MKTYLIIFLLFFLLITNSKAQVISLFEADKTEGCGSMIVQFANLSTGSEPLSYLWDFGNGVTSTEKNPQIIYKTSGTFTVSLIVQNLDYSDTLVLFNHIVIHKLPIAAFKVQSGNYGCQGTESSFTNECIAGDTTISSFTWDFGDGKFGTGNSPLHVYNNNGNFGISLFITDNFGCESSVTKENQVLILKNPTANFTAVNPIACSDTNRVIFNNLSNGTPDLSNLWDFGDGQSSTLAKPTHFYSAYGTYSVSLKVTDLQGCSDSLIRNDYVILQTIHVAFTTSNDSICKNQDLEIINNSTGTNNILWSFGDGSNSTQIEPNKSYNEGGTYEISLIGNFRNLCYDTANQTIWVDSLSASFETDQHYSCEIPFDVSYTNTSTNVSQFHWIFGNGETSSIESPDITINPTPNLLKSYKDSFTDTLIVTSPFGCIDTTVVKDNIRVIIPKILFTPNDTSINKNSLKGCSPLQISFINKSQTNNPNETLTNYHWDFGNGETSNNENPVYTYHETGNYIVELVVTNSANCINRFQSTVFVGSVQTPNFEMLGNSTHCGSEPVVFIDKSMDTALIDQWLWTFSDNGISYTQNPSHVYTDTGFVSASLEVFYNGCKSERITKQEIAYIKGPAGSIKLNYDCSKPLEYTLISDLKGADSLFWNFGDNTFDSTQTTIINHKYTGPDSYIVRLYGKNEQTNCQTELISVLSPRLVKSSFNMVSNQQCIYDSIYFDGSTSEQYTTQFINNRAVNYYWTINNDTSFFTLGNFYYTFPEKGTYSIKLQVKDVNNCTDDTTQILHLYKPEPGFISDTTIGCSPLNISFQDKTISEIAIAQWNWFLNNKLASTSQNPIIQVSDTGFHTVKLVVFDSVGCTDSIVTKKAFYTSIPQPKIHISSLLNCQNDSVVFENQSEGKIVSLKWDFGDDSSSFKSNTTHVYTNTGNYEVSLYLVDELGCDTIYKYPSLIHVEAIPVAGFTSNISNPYCYPSLVWFTDKSEGNINQWKWDFGDQSEKNNEQSPMHTYRIPGTFDISLTVSTAIGCKNELIVPGAIKINGPYAKILAPDFACINTPYWFKSLNQLNVYTSEWFFHNGDNFKGDSVERTYSEFGVFQYTLFLTSDDNNTCNQMITDSIEIPFINAAFTLSDTVGCQPFGFTATSMSEGYSTLEWLVDDEFNTQTINPEFLVQNPGMHKVELIAHSQIGCTDSSNIEIKVHALPDMKIITDTIVCINDTIQLFASGGLSYQWLKNQWIIDPDTKTPKVFPKEPTIFYVTVTDSNDCKKTDSVFVDVQLIPQVEVFNSDSLLIIGESIFLEGNVLYTSNYQWEPAAGLECPSCLSTLARPMQNTVYYLVAKDPYQCFESKDSANIKVDIKFSIALPTAFTPNGDGINDKVFVKGWGIQELVSFQVYNKFGLKVFETNDIAQGWDGIYKSSPLSADIYYYKVEVISYDGKPRSKTGEIYILK